MGAGAGSESGGRWHGADRSAPARGLGLGSPGRVAGVGAGLQPGKCCCESGRRQWLAQRQLASGPIWTRAVSARSEERHTVIWDKAQDLGRLIGQSAEYQALRRAETSLREDKETVAKLDLIQTLARKVDQAVSTGQMPDQATAEAYETAVRDLEMSPTGQAYVVARSNFEKLMQKVNQQISEGMEKGSASSIITLG